MQAASVAADPRLYQRKVSTMFKKFFSRVCAVALSPVAYLARQCVDLDAIALNVYELSRQKAESLIMERLNEFREEFKTDCDDRLQAAIQGGDFVDCITEGLDLSEIASHIDVSEVAGYIDVSDIASEFDVSDIAAELDVSDIAGEVSSSDVAPYVNISAEDVADHIDMQQVIEAINYRDIEEQVADRIHSSDIADHFSVSDITEYLDVDYDCLVHSLDYADLADRMLANDKVLQDFRHCAVPRIAIEIKDIFALLWDSVSRLCPETKAESEGTEEAVQI